MMKAVISGDIIAYTSLSDNGRAVVEAALKKLLRNLNKEFNTYGRIIKGDYLEIVVPEPEHALGIALIIKTYLKTFSDNSLTQDKNINRYKFFKTYGVRLVIGFGELSRYDPEKGIIDGEAIYLSGRKINEEATHRGERVVIKNTLFFVSGNEQLNHEIEPLLSLLDVLIAKATARQSEVVYLKLMNLTEEVIAKKMKITQSVVNQHSTSVGWNAIEKAVARFNHVLKNI